MSKAILIFCLLILIASGSFLQQSDFSKLTGPYLGQNPPGMTPELFAPEIISREDTREFAITFSPDGREFFLPDH